MNPQQQIERSISSVGQNQPQPNEVTLLLHSINSQMAELITEIRHLRSLGLTTSTLPTNPSITPTTVSTPVSSYQRPMVGEAQYISGPSHLPVFRCPITHVDGSKTYGPEAPNKSLAKFLANQQIFGEEHTSIQQIVQPSGPYKPTPQTQLFVYFMEHHSLFISFLVLLLLFYYRQISNQEAHSTNGNGDLVEVLNHGLNGEIKTKHDHGPGSIFAPVQSAQRLYNNLKHDYDVYQHQKNENQAHHYAQEHLHQYKADRSGHQTVYSGYDEPKIFNPRVNYRNGPTNRDMHSYNGNLFGGDVGNETKIKLPGTKVVIPQPPSDKIRTDKQGKKSELRKVTTGKVVSSRVPTVDVKASGLNQKQLSDYQKWLDGSEQQLHRFTGAGQSIVPNNKFAGPKPTNKSMHIQNGNTRQHKGKKHEQKRATVDRIPKKVMKDIEKLPAEKKLAEKYAAFLRNPTVKPPRLGSTGSMPTKLLHGYFETTLQMASPGVGTNNTLTNCTDMVAFLSPKMFARFVSTSDFTCPVNVGLAQNATSTYVSATSTATMWSTDFSNATTLKNEAGNVSSSTSIPMVRFVGGHVSIKCRCPMSTTAPPYMFGGILPSNKCSTGSSQLVDTNTQLNQLTSQQIRALLSTDEKTLNGFEGSVVYIPGSAKNLDFSQYPANYASSLMDVTPIPYIGMTGCPTTASVTIICSAWFEVQQTVDNAAYSGWGTGPKLAAEDIFDYLPAIKPVKPFALSQGVKGNSYGAMAQIQSFLAPKQLTQEEKLRQALDMISILQDQLKHVKMLVGCHELEDHKRVEQSEIEDGIISESEYEYANRSDTPISTPRDLAIAKPGPRRGPTNKEMHALNGNGSNPEDEPSQSTPSLLVGGDDIKTDVFQDWSPQNTNSDDPYYSYRGRRVYVIDSQSLNDEVVHIVHTIARNPTILQRSTLNALVFLQLVSPRKRDYMNLQMAILFQLDITGLVSYSPPAPPLVGVEPNPGPCENEEDEVKYNNNDSQPTRIIPLVGQRERARCSECGKVMFWTSKYQRYMCPMCTRLSPKDQSPLPPPSSLPSSPVARIRDQSYAMQPAKKRVKKRRDSEPVNKKEYFKVNAKGKFKHAEFRLKKTYEHAKEQVKKNNVWVKTEPKPLVTVAQLDSVKMPKFHDEPQNRDCHSYKKTGYCRYGDKCKYDHNVTTSAEPPQQLKEERKLSDVIEDVKLQDVLDSHNSITNIPPLIHHTLAKDKWFLSNNENRKYVPELKNYCIDLADFSRYPMAPDNGEGENVSRVIVGLPKSGFKFIRLPSTLVPELQAHMVSHADIDEKVYSVCKSLAMKMARNITGVDPQVQTDCILWGPYLAWKEVYIINQLVNPFSKLPYRQRGGYENLEFIDHDNYKLDARYLKDRQLDDRKNPGTMVEDYKLRCLPRFGNKIKLLLFRCLTFLRTKKDYELLVQKESLDIDIKEHKLLIEQHLLPRKDFLNDDSDYMKKNSHYYNPFFSSYTGLTAPLISQINGSHGSYTDEDDVHIYKHITTNLETVPRQKSGAGFWYPMFDKYTHKKYDQEPELQKAYWLNHDYRPVCYSNNLVNEKATLANRVTVETPIVDKEFMHEFLSWSKNNFSSIVNRRIKDIEPCSWLAYIERSNASPQMKVKLNATLLEMESFGYNDLWTIDKKTSWYWTTRKLFLKKENLPYRTPFGIKAKAARAIQGLLNLYYLVILGPWFMALQDHLKTVWNKDNWVCFTSGVDAVDAASVLNEMWTIIEDDVGTFDSSVHELLGEFEVWVSSLFGASKTIQQLMTDNNKTHGVTMLGGKYWMPGGRKSGDPFTSLFNSLLNILLHAFILHKHFGWDIRQIKANTRMLVAGDDNLMTINGPPVDFVPYMKKLGFNSEAIVRNSLDEAEFCSCRLYYISGKWVFGPMPGKVLSKLGFLNAPPENVSRESMMKGIAMGLLRSCLFIPPIMTVVRRILELTAGVEAYRGYTTRFKEEFWHMHFDYTSFDSTFNPSIYASLYIVYGWTLDMQTMLEVEMSTYNFDDPVPKNSVLNVLFDRDTAGPQVMAA